jgi:hypothetical protein
MQRSHGGHAAIQHHWIRDALHCTATSKVMCHPWIVGGCRITWVLSPSPIESNQGCSMPFWMNTRSARRSNWFSERRGSTSVGARQRPLTRPPFQWCCIYYACQVVIAGAHNDRATGPRDWLTSSNNNLRRKQESPTKRNYPALMRGHLRPIQIPLQLKLHRCALRQRW